MIRHLHPEAESDAAWPRSRTAARLRLPHGDCGQAGGIEVLPFGLLIFVAGTLILVNAWATVDAKLAVTAAAREAARTYVETNPAAADGAAKRAAQEALRSYGRSPDRLGLTHDNGDYRRCARVTFTATYPLPAVSIPFLGGLGSGVIVRARHSEIIDPYAARPGLGAGGDCGT